MLIDDLPRLSDEERALADDEYAVMPAALSTNLSIDDLIAQRTAGALRHANGWRRLRSLLGSQQEEAQLAAQIRRVRREAAAAKSDTRVTPTGLWICPTCAQ